MEQPFKDGTILGFAFCKDIAHRFALAGCDYDTDEEIKRQLGEFAGFLQEHGFLVAPLLNRPGPVDEAFVLKRSHVTEEGRAFIRVCLNRWTSARKKNGLRVLERCLTRFKSEGAGSERKGGGRTGGRKGSGDDS